MMSDTFCGYDGPRDEMIVAYVYGELAAGERAAFTRHLTRCLVCQREVEALNDLRVELAEWSPPSLGRSTAGDIVSRTLGRADGGVGGSNIGSTAGNGAGVSAVNHPGHGAGSVIGSIVPTRAVGSERALRTVEGADAASARRALWRDLPAWAQFAAAMLFVGVAAGLANLQITYDSSGLLVRTGWSRGAVVQPAGAEAVPAVTAAELAAASMRLRSELRAELRADLQTAVAANVPVSAPLSKTDQDEMIRQVRALLKDSEQRQQRELALRVAEVAQDAQAQRQADLVRIDRTLGALQNTTGTAVRRQEQLLNNLAVRVSQRQ
jgi:hypothetical protein